MIGLDKLPPKYRTKKPILDQEIRISETETVISIYTLAQSIYVDSAFSGLISGLGI